MLTCPRTVTLRSASGMKMMSPARKGKTCPCVSLTRTWSKSTAMVWEPRKIEARLASARGVSPPAVAMTEISPVPGRS